MALPAASPAKPTQLLFTDRSKKQLADGKKQRPCVLPFLPPINTADIPKMKADQAAQAAQRAHRKDRPRAVCINRNPPQLESEPKNEPPTKPSTGVGIAMLGLDEPHDDGYEMNDGMALSTGEGAFDDWGGDGFGEIGYDNPNGTLDPDVLAEILARSTGSSDENVTASAEMTPMEMLPTVPDTMPLSDVQAYWSELSGVAFKTGIQRLTDTDYVIAAWLPRDQCLNVCSFALTKDPWSINETETVLLCIYFQTESFVQFSIHKSNWDEDVTTCTCRSFKNAQRCLHYLVVTAHLSEILQKRPLNRGLINIPTLVRLDIEQKNKIIYFVPVNKADKWVQIGVRGANPAQWHCSADKVRANNPARGRCQHKDLLNTHQGSLISALLESLGVDDEEAEPDQQAEQRMAMQLLLEENRGGVTVDPGELNDNMVSNGLYNDYPELTSTFDEAFARTP